MVMPAGRPVAANLYGIVPPVAETDFVYAAPTVVSPNAKSARVNGPPLLEGQPVRRETTKGRHNARRCKRIGDSGQGFVGAPGRELFPDRAAGINNRKA